MKTLLLSTVIIIFLYNAAIAQKYFTKNGNISFFSATTMENIKADNNEVMSVMDAKTGDLQFSVLIKSFHFKKALMEEHFNENYMESEKYPKATFKGVVTEIGKVNFGKDGITPVIVSGDLVMHGVTQKVTTAGNITIDGGKITATSVFKLILSDYNISIPKVVQNNISKTIEIRVNCLYDQKM